VIEEIKKLCVRFEPVGSRVTCNPPPSGTDVDYLVYCPVETQHGTVQYASLLEYLATNGWELGGSKIESKGVQVGYGFESFTREDINLIITQDFLFFSRFMAATSVCLRLNLLQKEDRIALFQAVLYGNACWPGVPAE
jgi:hypothetical protein